jgi:hypothetical protein
MPSGVFRSVDNSHNPVPVDENRPVTERGEGLCPEAFRPYAVPGSPEG